MTTCFDQRQCRTKKLVVEHRSLKGQGALGLKSTRMKQTILETQRFERVILRALYMDDDKVFMDVD